MSIIDAFLLEILKKEGRPVSHQDIVEKGIEELEEVKKLTVPIRTKLQYTRWQGAKLRGSIYKRIAEKIGWDELNKIHNQGVMDHFEEFASTYFKPLIKVFLQINKNDYLKTFAQATTIYDYLYGNLDSFDTSDPDRLILNNLHCGEQQNHITGDTWGQDKISCVLS